MGKGIVIGADDSNDPNAANAAKYSQPWLFGQSHHTAGKTFVLCLLALILLQSSIIPHLFRLMSSLPKHHLLSTSTSASATSAASTSDSKEEVESNSNNKTKTNKNKLHASWIVVFHKLSLVHISFLPSSFLSSSSSTSTSSTAADKKKKNIFKIILTSFLPSTSIPSLLALILISTLIILFSGGVDFSMMYDAGYNRFGFLGLGCLSIVMVLASGRNSILDSVFGVPFERAL
ncbi:hypothetical protein HDU97_004695, partial [Phlyctochytrium planicorne]